MLKHLGSSRVGSTWLRWLGQDMLQQLANVESKLDYLWLLGLCYPIRELVMVPMCLIPRESTKVVLLCKNPYRSPRMACGVPVHSADGTMTPSSRVFKEFIQRYWDNVTDDNYMGLYYESGVLVLNSSPTIQQAPDDKYSLTDSHFPLWTSFMVPLVRRLYSEGVTIVGLGVEGKNLMRGLSEGPNYISTPFPSDDKSISLFTTTMSYVFSEYLFDVGSNRVP